MNALPDYEKSWWQKKDNPKYGFEECPLWFTTTFITTIGAFVLISLELAKLEGWM